MTDYISPIEEIQLLAEYANYKRKIYLEEINSLVYFGNGGFPYNIVVEMAVHERRIHIKIINDRKKRQEEEAERRSNAKVLDQNSSVSKVKSVNKQAQTQIDENSYKVPRK